MGDCAASRGRLQAEAGRGHSRGLSRSRQGPSPRREGVGAGQIDLPAAAVLCRLEQILDAVEPRLPREVVGDVAQPNRRDRIDDHRPAVHRIAAADLDVRPRPDANAAPDPAAPYAVAKTLGEYHEVI